MSIFMACCYRLALITAIFQTTPYKDDVTYTVNARRFMIPIYIASWVKQDQIDHLVLYSSSNKGRTWREVTKTPAEQKHIVFSAPSDGVYWFTVQVVYADQTKVPSVLENAEPNLKVAVVTGSNATRKSAQQNDLEREVNHLREKVEKLEKRIEELEKKRESKR